jgi:hypothetical protein
MQGAAAPRSTEGVDRGTASVLKGADTRVQRARGRPKGSRNKSKSLIPVEMADAILLKMQPIVPPEHFEYMKGVIRDGKAVAVERELDTLILLLSRQMVPAIIAETEGPPLPEGAEEELGLDASAIRMPEFKKDVTERIKVLKDLIDLKMRQERSRDETANPRNQPLSIIFANRGIAGERLRVAIERVTGGLGGSTDEPEWAADTSGNVSVEISERPISLPGRSQGKADRVIDHDSVGDSALSVYPVEVSG